MCEHQKFNCTILKYKEEWKRRENERGGGCLGEVALWFKTTKETHSNCIKYGNSSQNKLDELLFWLTIYWFTVLWWYHGHTFTQTLGKEVSSQNRKFRQTWNNIHPQYDQIKNLFSYIINRGIHWLHPIDDVRPCFIPYILTCTEPLKRTQYRKMIHTHRLNFDEKNWNEILASEWTNKTENRGNPMQLFLAQRSHCNRTVDHKAY